MEIGCMLLILSIWHYLHRHDSDSSKAVHLVEVLAGLYSSSICFYLHMLIAEQQSHLRIN
jgi:hypothetical protein